MTQIMKLQKKDLKQKKNMSEEMETLHRMETMRRVRGVGGFNGKCRTEKYRT